MPIPWLSGLGAGLSQLGGDVTDERRRLRALQQAQAQFEAEQGFQRDQLGESKRHNTAMEALQNTELADSRSSTADLRKRQRVQTFSESAGRGGINYLNPEQAFESMNPEPQASIGDPATSAMPGAISALRGADTRNTFMKNIEPTAQALDEGNRSVGFIPGSESFGGAVLENKTFNPYASNSWRQDSMEEAQERLDFSRAMDDIQKAGDMAHGQAMKTATDIQQLTDLGATSQTAHLERERAVKMKAKVWSDWMSNQYPGKAHMYTPERFLGQMIAAPVQGFPSQNTPQGGGNPLIPGGGTPAQRPQQPAPPQGNPLIRPPGNPLIR